MKHAFFFALFFVFFAYTLSAQTRSGSISGRVTDWAGQPISFASVVLLRAADSGLVKTELTDDRGEFNLTPVANGIYLVKAIFIGYESYISDKLIVSDNQMPMPDIKLVRDETALKEQTITAQKPFIEVKPDMLVVNVENSIVSAGNSVMEVLARSPGVTVSESDVISLKGKQGVNIMMDGRTMPIAAADLANMLKSMPANSIEKIEIITNPSAKYDAAGTAGVINIITKKNSKMGLNASVTGGYGQGVYPKENAGFNLGYRENKVSVYLSYNASYRIGFSHVDWDRRYYTGSVLNGSYVQDNYGVLHFSNNIAGAGVDYNLTPKTTIGASVTGDDYYVGTKGYYAAKVLDQDDQLQSTFATNNTSSGNWTNYAPNLHLKHSFDSSGKDLSVDVDYARYHNSNVQDFTTDYFGVNGMPSQQPYILHGDITGLTGIRAFKADYSNPLPQNMNMDIGIKSSYVTEDNQPGFYDRSNGGNVYDSTKSDHFLYTENINAAYVNLSRNREKYSAQLGLRAEQTIVNGKELVTGQTFANNYFRLFPSLGAQDKLNADNDLRITLSRRIERPGYDDLNPYKFFVDPSTYRTGNPYLNPALTYAAELSHVYKQRLVTTLSYSYTENVIVEVILPSTTLYRVTIQTKENLSHMANVGVNGAYTIPVTKWWNSITTYDLFYSRYTGSLANTSLTAGIPAFDINISNKFTLPKDWSAELTVFYQSAQEYGFLNLTPVSMFNIGIQKNLLDKRITIKLSANDIFWHGNESGSSYFTNYTETFSTHHDTRQANIALTYRFGKKSVAPVHKHSGGAEEEKKRAAQGA